jgi:hypothetical protein
MQRAGQVNRSSLTKHGKLLVAQSMHEKGKGFIGAAILLRQRGGYEYVVLHLLCQGVEIVLKSFLLFQSYDSYNPVLKNLRHDLVKIADRVLDAFKLKPLTPAVRRELTALNSLYAKHLLRYGSFYDVLVDPSTIPSKLVFRRISAAIRLAERRTVTNEPSETA